MLIMAMEAGVPDRLSALKPVTDRDSRNITKDTRLRHVPHTSELLGCTRRRYEPD